MMAPCSGLGDRETRSTGRGRRRPRIGRVITVARTTEQVYDGVMRLGLGPLGRRHRAPPDPDERAPARDPGSPGGDRAAGAGPGATRRDCPSGWPPSPRRQSASCSATGTRRSRGLQVLARHYDGPPSTSPGRPRGSASASTTAPPCRPPRRRTATGGARAGNRKNGDLSGEQGLRPHRRLADGRAGRGGIETLRAAKAAVTPGGLEPRRRHAGVAEGQNPEAVGEAAFSPARFLTAYQGLSPRGGACCSRGSRSSGRRSTTSPPSRAGSSSVDTRRTSRHGAQRERARPGGFGLRGPGEHDRGHHRGAASWRRFWRSRRRQPRRRAWRRYTRAWWRRRRGRPPRRWPWPHAIRARRRRQAGGEDRPQDAILRALSSQRPAMPTRSAARFQPAVGGARPPR